MLKTRVITALCLFPLVIGALFLPNIPFQILLYALVGLCTYEYGRLIILATERKSQYLYVLLSLLLFSLGLYYPQTALALGALFWLIVIMWVFVFPRGQSLWTDSTILRWLTGWGLVLPAMLALSLLHLQGRGWVYVLALLLTVWSADIGAYFTGRFFGKHSLAPKVSPKKTWEGFGGGWALTLVVLSLYLSLMSPDFSLTFRSVLFISVGFILSVLGDLVESMIKRCLGVKDSGQLLPGHGGILDRLDSLLCLAPCILALYTMYSLLIRF